MDEMNVEIRPLSELKPRPRNARAHSRGQVRALADAIQALGFRVPVLVDEAGVVLAGHGRLEAAKLLGLHDVPVIRHAGMSEAQKRAFVLADNKLAERAGWDRETLAVELGELSTLLPECGFSIELTGFETGEVDVLLTDIEEEKAQDAADEIVPPPATAVSRPGDVWLLGRHRIVCGDARDISTLCAVMGDDRAGMVFTDPPYNVRVRDIIGRGNIQHAEFAMASGEMTTEEFVRFLKEVLGNAVQVSRDGAMHYVCMDWRHISDLLLAGDRLYGELKNICVWAKTNGGQGSLYRSAHEMIAVFKVGTGDHINNVELGRHGRNRTNVWHYAGINSFGTDRNSHLASHPTVKPVALVADAIKDVTKRGNIVLDVFGGSGTTLIAAERTARRARLIELEPRYVDVAIRRYESISRNDAVLAETGATFAEVARGRLNAQ